MRAYGAGHKLSEFEAPSKESQQLSSIPIWGFKKIRDP